MELDKTSGIYKIQSIKYPDRLYIGSAINIVNRWHIHLHCLRQNKHHSSKLQHHYNKYGEADLQFSILISCNKNELIEREQFFLDTYKPYFNISPMAGSVLGIKHKFKHKTQEHKDKIGKGNKGKKRSVEVIEKYKIINKGRKHSKETRDKMSIGRMGEKNGMFGRHHTKESNEKNRLNHIGRNYVGKLILNNENGIFYDGLRPAYESTMKDVSFSRFAKIVKNNKGRYKCFIYV